MNTFASIRRPLAVALMATLAVGAVAPLAEAGSRHRRYRTPSVERHVVRRPVYRAHRVYRHVPHARYTVWRSGHGPAIAGFLGGLFLGATLANAAPHGFVYWDPYCHRHFASLDLYHRHCRNHAHEHMINVIEVPQGYGPGDVHYCDDCGNEYWGDEHECY